VKRPPCEVVSERSGFGPVRRRRQLERAEEIDPLKGFGAACRAELESMRRRL
jgi:hypothetical protein